MVVKRPAVPTPTMQTLVSVSSFVMGFILGGIGSFSGLASASDVEGSMGRSCRFAET